MRRVLLGRQDGARADAVSDALTLPHVCGHEICARVLETDPAGALAPGTLVVVDHVWPCRRCAPCRAGDEQLCREPVVGSRYVARDELERAIRLVAGGRVQTVVDRVLPLDRAEDALAALEAGDVVGRVVLDVAGRYQSPDPSPTSPARR